MMGLQALLLCFAALAASAHGQSDSGFISIDCGFAGAEGYKDPSTQLVYSPDAPYTDTGVNRVVSSGYNLGNLARRYSDLRSFPSGTRNCYTLAPVRRGGKYLVRASFVYGNYDGLNMPPEFDLYLGVNSWKTVVANSTLEEIMAVATSGSMQVCLVNTGTGTPFISALELRPLQDSMYSWVNESQSLVLRQNRYNLGGEPDVQLRYPNDPYDRIWFTPSNVTGWTPVSNDSAQVQTESSREFQVPSVVMRTAVTAASLSQSLRFTVTRGVGERAYLVMHFAELQRLEANESRVFNVYSNLSLWYGPYKPEYLQAGELYTNRPAPAGSTTIYSLRATGNSTVPPILNAIEVYSLRQLSSLPTDDRDVAAIRSIKRLYRVENNWEGDPCAPREFMWEGLNCSIDASENPRIISLNLSSSRLAGGIPASIANLTALRTLDLSHNNFTGEIPEYLGELPALRFLNLASNRLNGSVPQILANKSQDGSLLLSIDGNPDLSYKVGAGEVVKEKKKIAVPIIIATSGSLVLLLVVLILMWFIKRRRKRNASRTHESSMNQPKLTGNPRQKDGLLPECHQFEFSEILSITGNFQKSIGRGGFGVVYHGYLPDTSQVAVKLLSQSSSQGAKEFQAEAQVLTRVHHKNLLSLLGYCNDKNNLALVYEFMPQGSLAKHLYGNSDPVNGLSWRVRLTIALDSAQGLDYLHNGCKPPIVHRDVKPANILLNGNFGAKLADFGLSKALSSEEATHISTAVAGTLGYLDPEYHRTYRLNEKSDVYSFGVVLLGLVTGRAPTSGGPEKAHITQWVLSRMEKGDIHSIADHGLQGNYDANSVWKVVDIAMACASCASVQRPAMSEVVVQLKECLATEAGRSHSHGFGTQTPDSMEIIPLNSSDSGISPSAR